VNKNKGKGIDVTASPDKTIQYIGEEQVVQF